MSLSTSPSQSFLWNCSCSFFTLSLLPIAKKVATKTLLPYFTLAFEPFSGSGSATWEAFTIEVKPSSSNELTHIAESLNKCNVQLHIKYIYSNT